MAWTEITRLDYLREGLRYASDTTNDEWALIAPFMPEPRRLGRPRKTNLRAVVDAMLYLASTGCQWRALPKDFPNGPRGQSDRRGDRQPVGQNHGKWRAPRI